MPLVGIVMGSPSDEPYAKETTDILDKLGISYEVNFLSAHRTPEKAREYGITARERGLEVLIAGAGMAAHLPGVMASWTTLPVIGVPLPGSDLDGLDSLLAIVQMPAGIPVATVAIGKAGARNAAFFAAQILALKHPEIAEAHEAHRARAELGPALMIPRYSRPAMARVWADDARYDKWLQIEVAVCEAWAEEEVIPEEEMALIRGASYDLSIFEEAMRETKHDMTAFLRAMYPSVGAGARYLHLGLTTSDVWDTALSMQMVEAVDLLLVEVDRLIGALEARARKHKDTVMIGRTHGVHAEPITFGLKLALWVDEMRRNRVRMVRMKDTVGVGKISGAVGTYALVSPEIEARVCHKLGLRPAQISSQIVQRGYPCGVCHDPGAGRGFSGEVRHGAQRAAAHGNPGGGGAVRQGTDGVLGDAAQAKPDNRREDLRAGAGDERERGGCAGGRGAVERAGHQPFVRGADHIAGHVPGRWTTAWTCSRGSSKG